MALLNDHGWGFLRGNVSHRATAAAFKVGERAFKKKGGASAPLKEAVRLYRESQKPE